MAAIEGHSSPSNRKAILDILLTYFSNSGISGTVANIPKSAFSQDDWAAGWMPVAKIATFKRLQALTKNPLEVASVAVQLAPLIFEVSQDGSRIRRRMPYDAKEVAAMSAQESLAKTALEATGFATSTTTAEVSAFFSNLGPVASASNPRPGVFAIEFQNPQDMVRALAVQNHTYEDAQIQVRGVAKAALDTVSHTETSPEPCTALDAHAGVSSYPRNRVVKFALQDASVTNVEIKEKIAMFATVHSVELAKGAVNGYVRFKAGVAKQVLDVVARNGGIQVNGEFVTLSLLSGEEERLFWTVQKEKEKIASATPKTPAPPKPANNAQSRRANARLQRRADSVPYGRAGSTKTGRKTAADRKKATPTKAPKVKVDELESLFSNWNVVAPDAAPDAAGDAVMNTSL
ncbi:hypothetical protein HDU87_005453 [Geranomyces variabilis]|uniref:RRM domain-containing protein n=1 Tax=Geranomyces variabilis TaxID=109894 RepID=A0AAD5XP86_9FUNG|nr:hypothetical protein HDU87_005453 [Geranomyces variabilis]